MLAYIRNALHNNSIQFKPVAIQVQTEKIIYSDADKLNYLTEKYPIITEFKKKFGLENIY
jgi:DNA polymerase-3 subunit gamma/tau